MRPVYSSQGCTIWNMSSYIICSAAQDAATVAQFSGSWHFHFCLPAPSSSCLGLPTIHRDHRTSSEQVPCLRRAKTWIEGNLQPSSASRSERFLQIYCSAVCGWIIMLCLARRRKFALCLYYPAYSAKYYKIQIIMIQNDTEVSK